MNMSRGGGKALLVHGEPQVRNALARLLRGEGFRAVVAATGEEALALAQDDEFRVVITELELVGMGGVTLLSRLSPLQKGSRFILLGATGSINTELLPRGHGMRVFFEPWSDDELLVAVRRVDEAPHSILPPSQQTKPKVTRVLLVEDDPADAMLFETGLRLRHPGEFAVTVAPDMASAETLLRKDKDAFDVISLDLGLPDAQGLQAVGRIQAEAPHIGFIVLSSSEDPELAIETVKAGAQDYLVKRRAGGTNIAKSLRYAEQRKRAEQHLANIAFHDQLTGLANRNLFRQRVAKALGNCRRRGDQFAVLLLDMDRFKSVNDALGHDAGDAFLQQIADRLRAATRETDTVARLGGDEFAVLATGIGAPSDLFLIVERVLAAVRKPIELSGTCLNPTTSIGAALYPISGEDSDTLLAAADAAMYVAKREGRNGYHIHGAELTRQIAQKLQLENQLRQAIDRREFMLHYQPQISPGGDFVGAEALLRWLPPGGELVSASEFIGVLEDTGLIMDLGPWIIRTACQQLGAWRSRGYRVDRMAINLSARQLLSRDFTNMVRDATRSAGLAPKDIELELTEGTLLRDTEAMRTVLGELHSDGFRLALDDFGTGYCSVAYLRNFPIDTLKVDGSFVQDIASDSYRRNLVGGLIQLARRLDISVVAEGVETTDQRDALSEERCGIMQGFLFGSAISPDEFAAAAPRVKLDRVVGLLAN
jgi:diguanylate cyclase (GGDEF)-like protein